MSIIQVTLNYHPFRETDRLLSEDPPILRNFYLEPIESKTAKFNRLVKTKQDVRGNKTFVFDIECKMDDLISVMRTLNEKINSSLKIYTAPFSGEIRITIRQFIMLTSELMRQIRQKQATSPAHHNETKNELGEPDRELSYFCSRRAMYGL